MSAPAVITAYLAAASGQNFAERADCFTADGTVTDEGRTYRGHTESSAGGSLWRANGRSPAQLPVASQSAKTNTA
jgi:hypothetical protein